MEAAAVRPNADLAQAVADAEAQYRNAHPKSAARQTEAAQHMPGGNTRTVLYFTPFPLTWAGGKGNRLTDIDGREYVDMLGEYTAGLYGHSDPIIAAALKKAIDDGTVLGGPNQYEGRLAAAIRARFPSVDLIRFTNSGTEANMLALQAIRAQRPDRPKVMAFEHGYHGSVFYFSKKSAALNMQIPWVVGEYNEVEKTRALFAQHGKELAAVIVEPMQGGGGCIPGTKEFLQMLRDECTKNGIALIFDEVMTSRLSSGGLQKRLGITPDITSFGKYLGGGASFGAFGGKRELMERFDPNHPQALSHAGTFNNNVMSMAGGLAGLTQVFTPAEAERINALGDRVRDKINAMAKKAGSSLQATGVGSLINLHFSRKPIRTPADTHPSDPAADKALGDLHKLLHLELIDRGYYMARRGFIALSLPTTEKDTDGFVAALADILETHGALIERSLPAGL